MNPWKVISDEDVESIHKATLRVLSEVGIVLTHTEIRERLNDASASIQEERVLLPPEMVEKALADCGKKVTTVGRNGQEIVLGDGSLNWHNLGGPEIFIIRNLVSLAVPTRRMCVIVPVF